MSLLVLDAKRLAQSRLDCLPCLRVPYRDATGAFDSIDLAPLHGDSKDAVIYIFVQQ